MTTLRIIDPHIHLWDIGTGLYPGLETPSTGFVGDNTAIARDYLLPAFLAEAQTAADTGAQIIDIVGAVHVEAFPTDPLREVRHVQAMADMSPVSLTIVGHANLSDPGLSDLLDAQSCCAAFRGIRQVLNRHPDPLYNYVARDYMDDPAWQAGFRQLAPRGLSFDLQLYPAQMAHAARLAADNPDTRIILNHAGMWVDRTAQGWRTWREGLRLLAAAPNVRVKLSGLGMFDRHWTVESLRPLILETIDAFGPDRAMFASNFPVDKLFSSYGTLWSAFAQIAAPFSKDERDRLFFGTAAETYRLG